MSDSRGQAELVVDRVIDAPVEEVWQGWTEREYVTQWWAQEGFTMSRVELDVRERGTSLICIHSPEEEEDYCSTWTYRKVEPQRRLEFIAGYSDVDLNKVDPAEWGVEGVPADVPTEVLFQPLDGGKTRVTYIEHSNLSEEVCEALKVEIAQSLDRMAALFEAG
jgi:uncharacterized protein YndB with AHSA1/START domain